MHDGAGVESSEWMGFEWSPWLSLHPDSEALDALSTDPGLYRVRHEAYEGLVYVGETGRSLRGRVRALARGVFDGEMPFSDPTGPRRASGRSPTATTPGSRSPVRRHRQPPRNDSGRRSRTP